MPSLKELQAALRAHDIAYYREGRPTITDHEYDLLKKQVEVLSREEHEVGDDRLAGFEKHTHLGPMLSLANTYNAEELSAFLSRVAKALPAREQWYTVEPKIDGLAISLTYEQGRFRCAVTRGNKTEGDDVTRVLEATYGKLPATLPATGHPVADRLLEATIELRGEVYMGYDEFARINEERALAGLELYANPRNLASGTLKSLDLGDVAQRRLRLVIYGLGYSSGERPSEHNTIHEIIRAWGFPGLELSLLVPASMVWDAIQAMDRARKGFSYPTDGAVVKLNSVAGQDLLGITSNSPRWAIAYKFPPEQAETVLEAIDIQIGRTGVATPVARLRPVYLSGSTVANATLHNLDRIREKDIRVGDTVVVEKAGEIIPSVVRTVREKRPPTAIEYQFPSHCPDCSGPLTRQSGDAAYRCRNAACPAQLRGRIAFFVSKPCLDVRDLGDAVVAQLIDRHYVRTVADLYRLTPDQLATLDKFAAKSIANLLGALADSKRQPAARVLTALGIPNVGTTTAKDLLQSFSSITALMDATIERLMQVPNVGRTTAEGIVHFFQQPANRSLVAELGAAGLKLTAAVQAGGKLTGKTFVLTGTLPNLTREEAQALIEAAGGRCAGSVSKKTAFVVAGAEAGSKLEKARQLAVPVLDEAGLHRLLAES